MMGDNSVVADTPPTGVDGLVANVYGNAPAANKDENNCPTVRDSVYPGRPLDLPK